MVRAFPSEPRTLGCRGIGTKDDVSTACVQTFVIALVMKASIASVVGEYEHGIALEKYHQPGHSWHNATCKTTPATGFRRAAKQRLQDGSSQPDSSPTPTCCLVFSSLKLIGCSSLSEVHCDSYPRDGGAVLELVLARSLIIPHDQNGRRCCFGRACLPVRRSGMGRKSSCPT